MPGATYIEVNTMCKSASSGIRQEERESHPDKERKWIMEEFKNMQQNKIEDDELEQVGGGRLFDLFTMEFREFFGKPDRQDFTIGEEGEESQYGVNTLEMRVDPKKKTKSSTPDVIKL